MFSCAPPEIQVLISPDSRSYLPLYNGETVNQPHFCVRSYKSCPSPLGPTKWITSPSFLNMLTSSIAGMLVTPILFRVVVSFLSSGEEKKRFKEGESHLTEPNADIDKTNARFPRKRRAHKGVLEHGASVTHSERSKADDTRWCLEYGRR